MSGFIQQSAVKQASSLLPALALAAVAFTYAPVSQAGATFKIDDTKWLSIGAGLRTSFRAVEGASPNGDWSNNFNLDNMRLYLNAQLHKYIKIEFNTDCQTCGNGGEVRVLDAIGKFEIDPMFNVWVGRMLVPAERREMNGPFYNPIYNTFNLGTPFDPADFNTVIQDNGTSAGSYGRDDGGTIWGEFFDQRLHYAVGFFRGLRGGANQANNILYAQRFEYMFWGIEENPGYYTSGTYYGKAGDILTLGISNQYQKTGAGIETDPGNFRGTSVDLLLEKVLPEDYGVFTFNGEYKNYDITDGYSQASRDAGGGFGMFEGNSFDVSAMFLLPQEVWIGQFQPYVRYVGVYPTTSADRDQVEVGVNYVIDGHNALIALSWQYGDLLSMGTDYTSDASGENINAITLGFQFQI
ncbi:hypothetical protein AU255_15005 [Methyloprofundus sedimenti]|uniref:Short chain amide porin n=1 Tax=Methyloprofundus sedimenti TaxID=1420851 RepID=A0A1V8M1V1_9GAMM|nr:hypothetical protein [Methyloprofundus sedimenti]OQK15534.1 hypothetical protein AU255_15005 [Methyloprofundus sedimenti]